MISVRQAEEIVTSSVSPWGTERVSLQEAHRRILREDIRTDRDIPAFPRVMMDGFAFAFGPWASGTTDFSLQYTVPAGTPPPELAGLDQVIGVMTGGVLPSGCDSVIPIEDCLVNEKKIRLRPHELGESSGMNVHDRGKDCRSGGVVLKSGTRLRSPEIAVAASVGATSLEVAVTPRVVLLSTGDELVPPEVEPASHQIRWSNPLAIHSLLRDWGDIDWLHVHVRDDANALRALLDEHLPQADIVLLTGGVSKGVWDVVPDTLVDVGVTKHFHRVSQKPGKPLWFGTRENTLVFGLPGNPVSSLISTRRYVVPVLNRGAARQANAKQRIVLPDGVQVPPRMTIYVPVRSSEAGFVPVKLNNSGDYFSLAGSDGFIEVHPGARDARLYEWRMA